MAIGLPSITVEFKKKANTAIQRSNRGIVALILKDTTNAGLFTITNAYDIPSDLSEDNKKYIKMALLGNATSPHKIVCYSITGEDTLDNALNMLETVRFNYLAMPGAVEADNTKIKDYIEKMRNDSQIRVKSVLANTKADSKGIINLTTNNIEMELDGETFTASSREYCVAVAGLICGTPSSQAVTYVVPKNVINIPPIAKTEANNKINNGEFILVKEMGKIRVARGINSLTTGDTEEFKKIKLVDTEDMIHDDIRTTIIDSYVGKVPNTYLNKCTLISAIHSYLTELSKEQLIESDFTVGINIEEQTKYLKSQGIDVSNLSEQEIKEHNTKDKVFLLIQCSLVDSIEDVKVVVNI